MADAILIPLGYGALTIFALTLAIVSKRPDLIETGAVLLLAWLLCNAVVILNGHTKAPLLIPTIDAILGLFVAGIAAHNQSRIAAVVFAIFLGVQMVHVAAFRLHTQGSYSYFLTLNLLYICQLVVVGGAGVASVVARLTPAPRMADRFSRGGLFSGRRPGSRQAG